MSAKLKQYRQVSTGSQLYQLKTAVIVLDLDQCKKNNFDIGFKFMKKIRKQSNNLELKRFVVK